MVDLPRDQLPGAEVRQHAVQAPWPSMESNGADCGRHADEDRRPGAEDQGQRGGEGSCGCQHQEELKGKEELGAGKQTQPTRCAVSTSVLVHISVSVLYW